MPPTWEPEGKDTYKSFLWRLEGWEAMTSMPRVQWGSAIAMSASGLLEVAHHVDTRLDIELHRRVLAFEALVDKVLDRDTKLLA